MQHGIIEAIYHHFLKGLKKTTMPVWITGVLAKIRTKNLSNTRLVRYNYTDQVGTGISNSDQIPPGISR
jgi:hypothetical protein